MRKRWLAAILAMALVGCGGVDPVEDRAAAGQVQNRFEGWVRAWNSFNPANLEPFYIHKDHLTVTWPDGERTRGWNEEQQFQRQFLSTVMVMNLVPRDPTITLVRRNLALVTFGFSLDLFAGGRRQIGPGQGVMLWQKEGGTWMIYAAQLSYTRSVQQQLSEPPTRVRR